MLIQQFFHDVSDSEAANRVRLDLRWKMALDLALDDPGFHYTTLSRFRSRLMKHGQERYAFDKLVQLGIAAGFFKRDGKQVIDSTPIHDTAALQDTYALLRNSMRKLLLAMAKSPSKGRRMAKRLGPSQYMTHRKPELDWSDPKARREHLQQIVDDAERLMTEIETISLPDGSDAQRALALLEQIVAQDIDTNDKGQHEIKQGVAKNRAISTVDTEMRHGRKSSGKRFDGYKGHVAVDTDSELVTEVTVTPANVHDAEAVEPLLDNEADHHDIKPKTVVGDQCVIDGERRRILAEREIEAVGKVPIRRPGGRYAKADFDIDLGNGTVICPAGHSVNGSKIRRDKQGREWQCFTFPCELCQVCPQREQCTTAQRTGRTVTLHPQEALLQATREEQHKEDFKDRYGYPRSTVERVIGHLTRHGFRKARYNGAAKTLLQALWSAAAVNLQRLMGLMGSNRAQQALSMA